MRQHLQPDHIADITRQTKQILLDTGPHERLQPENRIAITTFERQGMPRRMRLKFAVTLSAPVFVGATLGYWFVSGQAEIVKLVLLAFTVGILITVVVEEMILLVHEGEDARFATVVFVGSFALFTLLSVNFD